MKAVYGQYTREGSGAEPWTDEDQQRLDGPFVFRVNGTPQLAPPHVMTLRGPFWIGKVKLPPAGVQCGSCGAAKVTSNPVTRYRWCFGCGRPQ